MIRHCSYLGLMLLAGCDSVQSVTGNDGRQSELISTLFWIFLTVAAVVYLIVLAFLAAALFWIGIPETRGRKMT